MEEENITRRISTTPEIEHGRNGTRTSSQRRVLHTPTSKYEESRRRHATEQDFLPQQSRSRSRSPLLCSRRDQAGGGFAEQGTSRSRPRDGGSHSRRKRTGDDHTHQRSTSRHSRLGAEQEFPMEDSTRELIMVKWTNIRDTFVKSLRPKMGKPKRKYIYHNNLKFLKHILLEDVCESEVDGTTTFFKEERESEEEVAERRSPKKRKKKVYSGDYEAVKGEASSSVLTQYGNQSNDVLDFVQVEEQVMNDPRVMNEDEAFFASLLPTVVKYNEDDRLEFRIQVLAVMRKIKDQKRWND